MIRGATPEARTLAESGLALRSRALGEGDTAPRGSRGSGAERGWAYQRAMELLVESRLSPMEVLVAGTLESARFFGADDRLGSLEPGKVADLVLVEGDPLADIRAMRRVKRVMLSGRWVALPRGDQALSASLCDEPLR